MAWQADMARMIVEGFSSSKQPADHEWVEGTSVVIGPPNDDDVTNDLVIGLVDRQGPTDETFGHVYGRPNLTVVVRSPKMGALVGFDVAQDLFLWLTSAEHANFMMGETPVQRLDPTAWPGYLRRDAHHRVDVTMEIGVWLGEFDA
ncbi:hypothetical protein SEA_VALENTINIPUFF_61 [Microbacterium phage ValentiniPuff]|uniref:Tail terminator n=1 Tax=Microbacterium phage ValentiniPuff TaxID=2315705 RepID=A0A386KPX7_9CAUD|nr:hypothetical protein SEA_VALENTINIPUFF_61 [Microbacterium phage ValentiniPuff]